MYIILLVVLANVFYVTGDCDKDVCVSDFFKEFFKDEETAVFKNKDGVIVEEEIEIVDLDTILKEISNLLTNDSDDTELVKNYENKSYVFVKTFNLHHNENHDEIKEQRDQLTNNNNSLPVTPSIQINITNDTIIDSVKSVKITDDNFEEILKKAVEEDNEIFNDDLDIIYDNSNEDNSTDYPDIDYIEIYKDAIVEEYLYVPTESILSDQELNINLGNQSKSVDAFDEYTLDTVEDYENKSVSDTLFNLITNWDV